MPKSNLFTPLQNSTGTRGNVTGNTYVPAGSGRETVINTNTGRVFKPADAIRWEGGQKKK